MSAALKIQADIRMNIKMGMSPEMAEFVAYANNGLQERVQDTADVIASEQVEIKKALEIAGFQPFTGTLQVSDKNCIENGEAVINGGCAPKSN